MTIYIGTEPAQWLPTEVLKHSILKNTKLPVTFHELKDISLDLDQEMYTGFSFYRFAIPSVCNFQGRAVYLDADIVVTGDIEELFSQDLGEHKALARPVVGEGMFYTSVMLMDCEKLKHWDMEEWTTLINAGVVAYKETMWGASSLNHDDFGDLPEYWNHLDQADETTKALHYTNVPTQPWKVPGHPFSSIFLDALRDALKDGVVTRDQIQNEIDRGHIYSGILSDLDK